MQNGLYEVRGVIRPTESAGRTPGIHVYLDFIVKDQYGISELVVPSPTPEENNSMRTIIRDRLLPNSVRQAVKAMSTERFEESEPGIFIDLNTQVVCEDNTGTVYIFDAEQLHHYRIKIYEARREVARREIARREVARKRLNKYMRKDNSAETS